MIRWMIGSLKLRTMTKFSLLSVNPILANEWNFELNGNLKPENVAPNSQIKVWWKCKNGHCWFAKVANRNKLGRGCPYCCGQKVCADNCLSTLRPDLLIEWHDKNAISPHDVSIGSGKKVWWRCKNNHEWIATIYKRVYGTGCPYCAGKKVCKDNCLLTLRPDLSNEWSDKNMFSPNDVTIKSGKKVWWECKNNHEWMATVADRTGGRGCPYCAGKKVCKDNCLLTLRPDLSAEWHPDNKISPDSIPLNSIRKVWWICKNGHIWEAIVYSRSSNNAGCPYCSKRISKKASRWLDTLKIYNRECYINIDRRKIYFDGFDKENNIVYEYLGNYWHGNPRFYDPNSVNQTVNRKFGDLLSDTISRFNMLINNGYAIIYKWEKSTKEEKYSIIKKNSYDIIKTATEIYKNKKEANVFNLLESEDYV